MWKRIALLEKDLQLNLCLTGGQSFRWKFNKEKGEFVGIFAHRVWKLKHENGELLYKVFSGVRENKEKVEFVNGRGNKKLGVSKGINGIKEKDSVEESLLREYLRLDVDLEQLYKEWGARDPNFADAAKTYFGVRMLKQDPIENIFSFICATNNHISRISSMVEKLCLKFGSPIAEVDGVTYHDFPLVSALRHESAEHWMRENGFGYRAKYIRASADMIMGAENNEYIWLDNLLAMDYHNAKAELMKLTGIGAKVADCICLMSLGHLCAVPVDTHVHQIAVRIYTPHLSKYKTVTPAVYNEIGSYFRNLYGDMAGWAHTILFCADLKMFKGMTENEDTNKTKSVPNKKRKIQKCS